MSGGDSVLRAMTDDAAFRVVVARTSSTVSGALGAQGGQGATARCFADLLTASVLFRHTMAPDLRVQVILRGADGRGSLIADSHPSGDTRGLIQLPEGTAELTTGPGALLRVMRTLQNGDLAQGVVELGASDGVTQGLMSYLHTSEQVDSMFAVGTTIGDDGAISAGGYLVQLLPGVGRGPLAIMTERLEDFRDVTPLISRPDFTPRWLLDELLYGMPFTELGTANVGYGCWCSEVRLVGALATLPRADIEHLMDGGEVLDITCDYCKKPYQIAPERLRGLLETS